MNSVLIEQSEDKTQLNVEAFSLQMTILWTVFNK